jgi:AcrR family transcriptional regulator
MLTPSIEATARGPLSRDEILRAALAYTDELGLDALSMHKLGARLGVKAMSLYNHVDGKDGLLDGLVDLLWSEVRPDEGAEGDWRGRLRHLAQAVRETVRRHPSSAPLIMSRPVLPVGALRVFKAQLDALEQAGFSRQRAVEVVRTVAAYAFGAALSELCWSCAAAAVETDLGRLRRISQMLPDDVPEDLLAVAMDICGSCDLDGPFELGLDLMLKGLEPGR